MVAAEDVALVDARTVDSLNDLPPGAIFIVCQIDGLAETDKSGHLEVTVEVHDFPANSVAFAVKLPAIGHIADGLPFVRIGGAAVDLDVTIISLILFMGQVRHEAPEPDIDPLRIRSTPGHGVFVVSRVKIGRQTDLT